ncbi:YccS/YhfK family putative transporter, partial [Salmonella enterica]
RLIISNDQQATTHAYQRMRVNKAHNTLFNSINQAMQEPGYKTNYQSEMKIWVTHSKFILEHINAMKTMAREHTKLTTE